MFLMLIKTKRQLIKMSGEEFVKKLLEGERYFTGIEIPRGLDFNRCEGFHKITRYLLTQNLEKDPIVLTGSKFLSVKAIRFDLPYVKGNDVDFSGADLRHAYFRNASFQNASFRDAKLGNAFLRYSDIGGADFQYAELWNANIRNANLQEGNFKGTDLRFTEFQYTDLRHAKNLDKSLNLGYANFVETKVTPEEEAIIKRALSKRRNFVVMR